MVIVFSASVIAESLAIQDYNIGNKDWNGASKLCQISREMGYTVYESESFEPWLNKNKIVLVILYPLSGINSSLNEFLIAGGRIILADDFGNGNKLLDFSSIHFSGEDVSDIESNYNGKTFTPTITNFKLHPVTKSINKIVTNHPTYLLDSEEGTSIAFFPSSSFIDANKNGKKADFEKSCGGCTFAKVLEIGKGRAVILSDPSIFINEMIDLGDNKDFYKNSISWLTENDRSYKIVFKNKTNEVLLRDKEKPLEKNQLPTATSTQTTQTSEKDNVPRIFGIVKPLFLSLPFFLLFLALLSSLLGGNRSDIVLFLRKRLPTSDYRMKIQYALSKDNYIEPAKYLGREFKKMLCDALDLKPDASDIEIITKIHNRDTTYKGWKGYFKRRRLAALLNLIREIEDNKIDIIDKKRMERLYTQTNSILNSIGVRRLER
jgi:hypothetical protein